MQLKSVLDFLESLAPLEYQESYDNSGLLVGEKSLNITGVLVSLDCTEAIVSEAISKKCNLIIAHHPIIFEGIKRFNNATYIQRTVQLAIKNDIAIYAIHTNLDNVYSNGVNSKIADRLGLKNTHVLRPKLNTLLKLATYCPPQNQEAIMESLFTAGAGHIGDYSNCSFSSVGMGTYKPGEVSNPTIGSAGKQSNEKEVKIEVIVPFNMQSHVTDKLLSVHPYEEVAYDWYPILNKNQSVGAGIVGDLPSPINDTAFLNLLKKEMNLAVIKYTPVTKMIQRVSICGGSGQFLIEDTKHSKSDAYITSDIKYHDFFDADNQLMICDIGHYESEKYTIDLLYDILSEKFSTFAILKTRIDTNPVKYF
tara:strand:+ start:5139 stop:6233 length:1095 start_codon:yes stop_codon:yes gene_type:complete